MDDWNWIELNKFLEEFRKHAYMKNLDEDTKFFDCWELKMAKALLNDAPTQSIRIAKIILALNDIGDVKIRID